MLDWIADTLFNRSQRRLHEAIQAQKPLYWHRMGAYGFIYRRHLIGSEQSAGRGSNCTFVIDERGITLYPQSQRMDIRLDFPRENLRWFGRPTKYQDGVNELWLHFEQNGVWELVQLRALKPHIQDAVRALKLIATPEQIKAYRRHRPYIHAGPVTVYSAEQDLYGVWTVEPQPLQLYLMPTALIMQDGEDGVSIRRVIPLEQIQQIEALRRVDALTAQEGVMRFKVETGDVNSDQQETHAYVLPEYIEFGEALAEAAKRSLEDPFLHMNMKKKSDKYADDDDDE